MMSTLKFTLGQIVIYSDRDFRGVIFEVDDRFRGPDEMLSDFSGMRAPKNRPWYHVLVDGTDKVLYVPERYLIPDSSGRPISHPKIDEIFVGFEDGRYLMATH